MQTMMLVMALVAFATAEATVVSRHLPVDGPLGTPTFRFFLASALCGLLRLLLVQAAMFVSIVAKWFGVIL